MPSRVRSPTPANTDTPPWFCATRWIISVMSTVLPTPAPPNKPILPPCTYGVRRSMTLMPVSNIFTCGSRASNAGGSRWICQRSQLATTLGSASSGSPITLKTWPRTSSPTGTEMPSPNWRTGVPRVRPSVGFRQMARTRPSPRCWAISAMISTVLSPEFIVMVTAWLSWGMESGGNSTSTTGPVIATMRPSLSCASVMVMRGPPVVHARSGCGRASVRRPRGLRIHRRSP